MPRVEVRLRKMKDEKCLTDKRFVGWKEIVSGYPARPAVLLRRRMLSAEKCLTGLVKKKWQKPPSVSLTKLTARPLKSKWHFNRRKLLSRGLKWNFEIRVVLRRGGKNPKSPFCFRHLLSQNFSAIFFWRHFPLKKRKRRVMTSRFLISYTGGEKNRFHEVCKNWVLSTALFHLLENWQSDQLFDDIFRISMERQDGKQFQFLKSTILWNLWKYYNTFFWKKTHFSNRLCHSKMIQSFPFPVFTLLKMLFYFEKYASPQVYDKKSLSYELYKTWYTFKPTVPPYFPA